MRKIWSDEAWEDYIYWQTQYKKTLKKINRLLEDINRNGYDCTGKRANSFYCKTDAVFKFLKLFAKGHFSE